ncbi:hypothetical protein JYT97_03765 [Haliea sp. AH-315-K21]|nr:hypothetical protein [Haliea sp. AH-315-K21]
MDDSQRNWAILGKRDENLMHNYYLRMKPSSAEIMNMMKDSFLGIYSTLPPYHD